MSVIEYIPVCGLTIKEALENAKAIACKEDKQVVATINDIVMCISPDSDIKTELESYRDKLNFKYEIEKMKRERQK